MPQFTSEIVVHAKGLLFDMDGILVSSIGGVERSWQQWCRRYGIPNPDAFQVPHGKRAVDILRMLKPEFNDAQVAEGLRAIEDFEIADTADLAVLPGADRMLQSLPPDRWAVVTSATQRVMLGRLAAAGLPLPERIISGDMVERGKPDPEPYRRGAELLGFAPAECIVVEDAPSGVGAGIAAGCRVLAVLGTHEPDELCEATWIAESLERVGIAINAGGLSLQFKNLAADKL
ncbi:MAG TPA: HAD-IA family hydrolase [Acidobacteriaceae bacterium]|nr:HAD-IA family hydrolase [Acidobacteriaceae bacterium]